MDMFTALIWRPFKVLLQSVTLLKKEAKSLFLGAATLSFNAAKRQALFQGSYSIPGKKISSKGVWFPKAKAIWLKLKMSAPRRLGNLWIVYPDFTVDISFKFPVSDFCFHWFLFGRIRFFYQLNTDLFNPICQGV